MMSKLNYLLLLLVPACLSNQAQVTNYKFTQSVGNYSTSLTGTFVGQNYQDDVVNNLPLPFTFTFNGTPYNNVNLSSNGFLSFATISGTQYNPISDPTTQEVISPFGQNLETGIKITANIATGSNLLTSASMVTGINVGDSIIDWNNDFTAPWPKVVSISGNVITLNTTSKINSTFYDIHFANGCIRTAMTGATPTRVCVVEYQNFSRKDVSNEFINFRVKLYETYDRVEVTYGPAAPGNSVSTSEIGIKGTSNSDFNSRTVSGNDTYITSKTATLITDACEVSSSKMPSGGVRYAWQPHCAIPGFSTSPTSPTLCAGQTITLSATAAETYSWVGIDTLPFIVVTPTPAANYKLKVRWGFCVDSVLFTPIVNPQPTLSFSQNPGLVCAGSNVTLTATGADSYTWSGAGTGSQVVVAPGAGSQYTLTGEANDCPTTLVVQPTVEALPNITILQSHATTICAGSTVNLTASGAVSYVWNTSQTQAIINISPSVTTSYTVTGSSANGCEGQAVVTQHVKVCPGVKEESGAVRALVVPGVFGDELKVILYDERPVTMDIRDVSGKLIYSSIADKGTVITTGTWSRGIYIVRLSDGTDAWSQKILKQ